MNRNELVRMGLVRSAAILGAMLGFSLLALFFGDLPERVPIHWNARGEADGFGPVGQALWMMPCITAALCVLLAVIPYLEPRRLNLERSARAYLVTWGAFAVLMAAVHAAMLLVAAGKLGQPVTAISAAVGAALAIVGNMLGKVRSNFWFGLRTPWTLSSERSWDLSNRLAGKLFMASGLATVAAAQFAPPWATLAWLIGSLLATTAIATVYSWRVWSREAVADAATAAREQMR